MLHNLGLDNAVLSVLIWVQTVCKSYQQTTNKINIGTKSVLHNLGLDNAVLPVLFWVQTVCKGYQQTTKVAKLNRKILD